MVTESIQIATLNLKIAVNDISNKRLIVCSVQTVVKQTQHSIIFGISKQSKNES